LKSAQCRSPTRHDALVIHTTNKCWILLEYERRCVCDNPPRGKGGGGSSYILVYADVSLAWVIFLTCQIDQWDAIYING
jgi:hypothetical protein